MNPASPSTENYLGKLRRGETLPADRRNTTVAAIVIDYDQLDFVSAFFVGGRKASQQAQDQFFRVPIYDDYAYTGRRHDDLPSLSGKN